MGLKHWKPFYNVDFLSVTLMIINIFIKIIISDIYVVLCSLASFGFNIVERFFLKLSLSS